MSASTRLAREVLDEPPLLERLELLEVLDEPQWRERERAHAERTQAWVAPRLARRERGQAHPVDDFLFDYYPYSTSRLTTWHPGLGVEVRGRVERFAEHPAYSRTADGALADPRRATFHRSRLDLAVSILESTATRAPQLGCFGMHEWAMVYGLDQDQVRHAGLPLRLGPADIADAVHEVGLRCTHIDAFRFFTPQAVPLNSLEPTRSTQPDLEQPGCLHATMDLYKYAQWFHPYVASELAADCFALARDARALDMQASPYDCSSLSLDPVRVETADGRVEYARRQRELMGRAAPLRGRLIETLLRLRARLDDTRSVEGLHGAPDFGTMSP